MYFSVLGRHKKLALYELEKVLNTKPASIGDNIAIFSYEGKKDKLSKLAGQTKIGYVVEKDELFSDTFLKKIFLDTSLVGTNDEELAVYLKKQGFIRRFKIIKNIQKTDFEIKTKGVEILRLSESMYGIVEFYQNIGLYETIDFQRPVRSMKIGMMPAKLTHYLVNIASLLEDNKVIYDPFCGLGTTLFVSNWLGYDVFGSDINPTPAKQNLKWWQTTPYYNPSKKIYIFKQDILQFTPHRKRFLFDVTNVVSEGYLGPVLNHYIDLKKAQELENQVGYVYFEAIRRLFRLPQLENIVFTFPVYFLKNKSRYIFEKIYDKIKAEGYELEILPEIYKRAGQKVGRQIVKIFK